MVAPVFSNSSSSFFYFIHSLFSVECIGMQCNKADIKLMVFLGAAATAQHNYLYFNNFFLFF